MSHATTRQLLPADAVARLVGITPGYVHQWARRRGIRPVRVGGDRRHLYHVADVRAAIRRPRAA